MCECVLVWVLHCHTRRAFLCTNTKRQKLNRRGSSFFFLYSHPFIGLLNGMQIDSLLVYYFISDVFTPSWVSEQQTSKHSISFPRCSGALLIKCCSFFSLQKHICWFQPNSSIWSPHAPRKMILKWMSHSDSDFFGTPERLVFVMKLKMQYLPGASSIQLLFVNYYFATTTMPAQPPCRSFDVVWKLFYFFFPAFMTWSLSESFLHPANIVIFFLKLN